jgi:hypothetical protein
MEQQKLQTHKILSWLSQYDYEAMHWDIRSKRLPGTVEAFLEEESFVRWLGDWNSFLWLEGRSMFHPYLNTTEYLLMEVNSQLVSANLFSGVFHKIAFKRPD